MSVAWVCLACAPSVDKLARVSSASDRIAAVLQRVASIVAALACGWQLALPVASASGNAIARFGGEQGTVNAVNPTAMYYDPAAIGFTEGAQLFIDGQLALRSFQWTHAQGQGDVAEPAGARGANYGTAKALNVFGGPMLGGSVRMGKFAFGAAAYAPFGGSVHFEQNSAFAGTAFPRAADGVARWHGYEGSTLSIFGTLAAAYHVGPLSLGVSGNLIYTTLTADRAQNLLSTGQNDLAGEGRSRLDVSGVQGSFGLGAMLELMQHKLWLAGSYQAQPGLGTMALHGTMRIDPMLSAPGDPLLRQVTLHQALPDIIRVGLRYKPSRSFELRLAGDLTRWSVLRTQCIGLTDLPCTVTPDGDAAAGSGAVSNLRRDWKNTLGGRIGLSYWASLDVELFLGLGYETAAVPDSTLDPVLADAKSIAMALGGRLQLGRDWFIAASYTHLQFLARDNTGRSALADPNIAAITQRPDGGGIYKQWVGTLDVNVLKKF
jgi:long-chain fatty acid transport protein